MVAEGQHFRRRKGRYTKGKEEKGVETLWGAKEENVALKWQLPRPLDSLYIIQTALHVI